MKRFRDLKILHHQRSAFLCSFLLLYIVSLFLDKVDIYVKGFEQHNQQRLATFLPKYFHI